MTDIRAVLAGWSQAKLAEKTGSSTHYIGMLELKRKFPSSEMIHRLASALGIDSTELFSKEIDQTIKMKNSQKAAFLDVGETISHFLSIYIAGKVKELDEN